MEDLRIYDYELNLLDIEHKIISSSWELYYNDTGKAEIHLPVKAGCTELLFENKYLLIAQGEKQAIVTGRQLGDDCVIYAKTPDWILTRRVLPYFDAVSGNTEELVRGLVGDCFSDCENFVLGKRCGAEATIELYEESHNALSDVVRDALETFGLGRRVYFDIKNKKWVFEVTRGEKRQLEISESGLTAYNTEYLFDMQDYFTSAFYERELTEEEKEAESLPVWEKVTKDEKSGLYKWETTSYKSLLTDVTRELSDKKITDEISAEVKSLACGKDYNIGDIVNVKLEKGKLKRSAQMRITGVKFWDEASDSGEKPMFGRL